jgi:hypothetical protein
MIAATSAMVAILTWRQFGSATAEAIQDAYGTYGLDALELATPLPRSNLAEVRSQ